MIEQLALKKDFLFQVFTLVDCFNNTMSHRSSLSKATLLYHCEKLLLPLFSPLLVESTGGSDTVRFRAAAAHVEENVVVFLVPFFSVKCSFSSFDYIPKLKRVYCLKMQTLLFFIIWKQEVG